jgi:hypothetical protein
MDAAATLAKYHELACHELNLFLFTHDRAFFDASVRPLVAARMRKSVVDHFHLSSPSMPRSPSPTPSSWQAARRSGG